MRLLPFVLALFLSACGPKTEKIPLNVGQLAPTFAAVQTSGKVEQFPEAYLGKPVVIRFWADWCKYCEGEMKSIESVYQRHQNTGLVVLAINSGQDKETIDRFMAKIGTTYPALMDEQSAIAKHYGVVGLPTSFFVDRQGKVLAKIVGEADEASFEQQVLKILR